MQTRRAFWTTSSQGLLDTEVTAFAPALLEVLWPCWPRSLQLTCPWTAAGRASVAMGPWGKGEQTKRQREKEAKTLSKHPMLESSKNNELDKFQQQKCPLCLCSVYLDVVMHIYHLKNLCWYMRTNRLHCWIDQWKGPYTCIRTTLYDQRG